MEKYLIASDIHGSPFYCRKLIEAFEKEKADKLVLLGDILYHGPRNDLPEGYAPKEVAAMLNKYSERILCVRGNCDAEVDQMMLDFPVLSDFGFIHSDGLDIYLTHGHHYNIEHPLPLPVGSILIYGHTHIPLDETRNGVRYLNPGSVSIPKNGSGHGYLVFENGEFTRKEFQ